MASKKFIASREELLAAYLELKSMLRVADRFGVSKKLILTYMNRYGIERVQRADPAEAYGKDISHLATMGRNGTEIARELSLSPSTVYLVAKRLNLRIVDSFHKGEIITHNGYRLVKLDGNGYAREHRLVMEQKLGRLLTPGEVVHHINGDKLDNRPDNLEVMSKGKHVTLHHTGKQGRGPDKKSRSKSLKI